MISNNEMDVYEIPGKDNATFLRLGVPGSTARQSWHALASKLATVS